MASTVLTSGTLFSTLATVAGGNACACGQELDCCARAHCPRCGVTLHA